MRVLWRQIRPYLSITVRFFRISYIEARSDYEGTRIGLLWMPISTVIFTILLGVVFHNPGSTSQVDFYLYVITGYVTFNFISATILGGTNIIQSKFDFAIHSGLTLPGLFGKVLCDRIFEYSINLVVMMIAILILKPSLIGLSCFLFIPFALMLFLTAFAMSYLINLVTVIFPDMSTIVKTIARIMFFATPVFWQPDKGAGVKMALERINPAAYFVKMVRQTFGVGDFAWSTWLIGLTITVVVCSAGYVAFHRSNSFVRNLK